MFTIKLYTDESKSAAYKMRILSAESFTILRDLNGAEITLHQKNGNDDCRYDIDWKERVEGSPYWQKAVIENSAGRTTEIIVCSHPRPLNQESSAGS